MVRVDTDVRVQTAIESGTLCSLAVVFVLAPSAVIVAVTPCEHRQTNREASRTAIVSGRTLVIVQFFSREVAIFVEIYRHWRAEFPKLAPTTIVVSAAVIAVVGFFHNFVRVIIAVRDQVAMFAMGHALTVVAGERVVAGGMFTE
jgi:hypothetical protein